MVNPLRLGAAFVIAVSLVGAVVASAQDKTKSTEQTWTGNISDAMCGKSHGERGGTMQKDHDCTIKCKAEGFVFVVGDKIYKIADQKMKELEIHAGHRVEITGTMKDDTITVSKVTMLPVKK